MRYQAAVLALVAVACTATTSTTTTSIATTTTSTRATTSTTTTTTVIPTACSGDFVARGPIVRFSGEAGDAVNVTGILSETLDGCDRTTIQLSTAAGAPATGVGGASIEWLEDRSVVRVGLDAVTGTAVADQILESAILDRVYVVRSLDGSIFVDLVASRRAAARATVESDPARVIVELIASEAGSDVAPSIARNVVVTTTPDTPAEYPMVVEGYARTFEATVLARIDGELVGVATAADWLETWGQFRFEISSGPDTPTELFVGEDPADGGDSVGVLIPLR